MNDAILIEVLATLKALAGQQPPDWHRPLRDYLINWPKAIGAGVLKQDGEGPTHVLHCGHIYQRRCGTNQKYGAAIWYSRSMGSDDNGATQYARLITFRDPSPAEALPGYVRDALEQKRQQNERRAR